MDFPLLTLPEDAKEAQKIFNSLPIKSQVDTVLQARGKERLHTLFLSEHPEQLVQQLPELEVFLTVKEVGEKDSSDLISLTTPEQFQYLLDLDFWKRDELDPEKILNWMEILLESELEEIGYRLRNGRLTDYGFPDLEEMGGVGIHRDGGQFLGREIENRSSSIEGNGFEGLPS